MTGHDLRAAAYAASATGVVDAHVASIVLCGPPSSRIATVHTLYVLALALVAFVLRSTTGPASIFWGLCGFAIVEAAKSIIAYRSERRRYLDAVRTVAEAYPRVVDLVCPIEPERL